MYEIKARPWFFALLLFSIAGLSAFAVTSEVNAQAPPAQILHKHARSVYVTVSMNAAPIENRIEGMLEIKGSEWLTLVKSSIAESQVFSEIYPEPGADYILNVAPKKMPELKDHFNLFSDLTLEMESEWTLTATLTDTVVMKRLLKTTHSDGAKAMSAFEKNSITRDGLIRKNIREGLFAVSNLVLQ